MKIYLRTQFTTCLLLLLSIINSVDGQEFKKYNLEHGLPFNEIFKICQDKEGFIYTATSAGVNVFNGNKFKQYNSSNTPGFNSVILDMVPISNNSLLIGAEKSGLFILNKKINKVIRLNLRMKNDTLVLPIQALHLDSSGVVWIGTRDRGLYSFHSDSIVSQDREYSVDCVKFSFFDNISITDICSSSGKVWIGTDRDGVFCSENLSPNSLSWSKVELNLPSQNIWCTEIFNDSLYVGTGNGLGIFDIHTDIGKTFLQRTKGLKFSANIVRSIVRDRRGHIWAGCQEDGIYRLTASANGWDIEHFTSDPYNSSSLNTNKILSLYADRYSNIWIGTWNGGLNRYSLYSETFRNIRNYNKANTLSENMTKCIAKRDSDSYWIGTYGNGVCLYEDSENSFYEKIELGNNNSVSSLYHDSDRDLLLIGTWGFGLKIYDGTSLRPKFENLLRSPQLKNDRIYSIEKDQHGVYWIATIKNGLFSLNLNANKIELKHIDLFKNIDNRGGKDAELRQVIRGSRSNTIIAVKHDYGVYEITTDDKGNILKLSDIFNDVDLKEEYSFNTYNCCFLDHADNLYIGTDNGILIKRFNKDNFSIFLTDENIQVQDIVEDKDNNLWIAVYSGGLIKYNPSLEEYHRYFSSSIFHKLLYSKESNKIIGISHSGLYELIPTRDDSNPYFPEISFDNLQVLFEPVNPGDTITRDHILKSHINYIEHLTLPFTHNTFSLDINTISFYHPEENTVLYKIEGVDDMWHEQRASSVRVSYNKIPPGDYTLQVKVSNRDNVWNPEVRRVNITILPPWWRTNWAYFAYFISISALFYYGYIIIKRRYKSIQMEKIQRITRENEKSVNEQKLQFFTNISHDIRTPLTLIIGPLEDIISSEKSGTWLNKQHRVMYKNASLLLRLVNQILDFRKIEKENLNLNYSKIDISNFTRTIISQFENVASQKGINLFIKESIESKYIFADKDKLEKVLLNLLSNALKYTSEDCYIEVSLTILEESIIIKVKDSGEGIEERDLSNIFKRFYQSENSGSGGTGIGLALVEKIVDLHRGTIGVESKKGEGSTFSVQLPIGDETLVCKPAEESLDPTSELEISIDLPEESGQKKSTQEDILIIDDNDDIREYLKDSLQGEYKIYTASNGLQGVEKAKEVLPTLIICDIMMNGIDGIEVCEMVKTDINTSHIPLILLTSKTSEESTIEGYKKGADDYITKPFSMKLVKTRVQNLIMQRSKLREKISLLDMPICSTPKNMDEEFIAEIVKFIEDNLSNADLSVEDIASSVSMTHDQYYRKIKNITGLSASKFTRKIRLNRAAKYLKERQYTISEILYRVGFSTPSYFTRCFKEEFGCTPSEMMGSKK